MSKKKKAPEKEILKEEEEAVTATSNASEKEASSPEDDSKDVANAPEEDVKREKSEKGPKNLVADRSSSSRMRRQPTTAGSSVPTKDEMTSAALSYGATGTDNKLIIPTGSQIREEQSVMNVGFALNHAVFRHTRTVDIRLPALAIFMVQGLEGVPLYADPAPDVNPTLALTIMSHALREVLNDRDTELSSVIETLAAQFDIPNDITKRIVEKAFSVREKLLSEGVAQTVASLTTGAYKEDDLPGAFSKPPKVTMDMVRRVFDVFTSIYTALNERKPLSAVQIMTETLLADPDFRRLHAMIKGIFTNPLNLKVMTLYNLASHYPENDGRDTFPRARFPEAVSGLSDEEKVYSPAFGINTSREEIRTAEYDQFKYQFVNNTFKDVDLGDLITSVMAHDKAMFPIPTIDLPIHEYIEHALVQGRIVGYPKISLEGNNLFLDPRFELLMGWNVLKKADSSQITQLHSTIKSLLDAYPNKQDSQLYRPGIEYMLRTMTAVLDSFSQMNGTFLSFIRDHHRYSHVVKKNVSSDVPVTHHIVSAEEVDKWLMIYDKMMTVMTGDYLDQSHPSYLFSPARIAQLPPLLVEENSSIQSMLMNSPWLVVNNNKLVAKTPIHEYRQGSGAVFYSSSANDDLIERRLVDARDRSTFSMRSRPTVKHHVVHMTVESTPVGPVELERLFRHIPLSLLERYDTLGKLRSALGETIDEYMILSNLISRQIKGYVRDFDSSVIRASIIGGFYDQLETVSSDIGDMNILLNKLFGTRVLEPLRYDKGKGRIAAIEHRGTELDLGSSNLVFIYEDMDQLFVEKSRSLLKSSLLTYPLFAMHSSDVFMESSLASLLTIPPVALSALQSTDPFFSSSYQLKAGSVDTPDPENEFDNTTTEMDTPWVADDFTKFVNE